MPLSDRPGQRLPDAPQKKVGHLLVLCGTLVLFGSGCGGGGGGGQPAAPSSPATTPTPTTRPTTPPGESVVTLTADQLADKVGQYTGKVVTVSGVAGFVSTKPDGSGVVQYQASGGRKGVRASFPAGSWTKDKIKPGDAVGAKGTVGEAGGAIEVGGCELVLHQSNTTPPTGVSPLAAQALAEKFRAHGGKVVTVEGVVESAVETRNSVNVVLGTTPGFPKVRLMFPKGKWTGDKPAAGDAVTAKGTVTKAVTATTFVDVSDCQLVKHTLAVPDEGIPVTAEDVTAEFEKDPKAAEAKYKDKTLRVTGEVLRVGLSGKSAVVFVKGATPTDKKKTALLVSAVFTGDAQEEAKKLKAGDTVTFTGKVLSFKVAIANNDWTLQLVQPKLVK